MAPTPATHQPRLVLVVDDDPWARTMTAALLASEGYEAMEARNGEEALVYASQHAPALILLDLALPTKSGLDVLRELKAAGATRDIPVVVVSAYANQVRTPDTSLADALVQKPFDLDRLISEVQRLAPPVEAESRVLV